MKTIKNIILIISACSGILTAQNIYKIAAGEVENSIKITLNNPTNLLMKNIEVKLISAPEWVEFQNENILIEKILSQSSETAAFYFDINTTAPINHTEIITFSIKEDNRSNWHHSIKVQAMLPAKFELSQNFPNPFNPSTTIKYSIAEEGFVNLTVFNLLGEKIATLISKNMKPGRYTVDFDANNLSTGIYVYRLDSGKNTSVKKMILMK